jgi:signal recognition particle GTPase
MQVLSGRAQQGALQQQVAVGGCRPPPVAPIAARHAQQQQPLLPAPQAAVAALHQLAAGGWGSRSTQCISSVVPRPSQPHHHRQQQQQQQQQPSSRRGQLLVPRAMFDTLSASLSSAFKGLQADARLTPENMKAPLRDVRRALLEADVSLPVVRHFIKRVEERAQGLEVCVVLRRRRGGAVLLCALPRRS